MKIPKMKNSDRIAVQLLAVLGVAELVAKTKNRRWLLLSLFIPFIGSEVSASKNNENLSIKIDSTYDSHEKNVL